MKHLLHPFQFLVIAVFGSMHGRQLLLNVTFGKRIESYVNSSARSDSARRREHRLESDLRE